ncbi:hypothetical protein [Nostoc sp. MS1]|uniref:hypothetical protein n=1 Tax=Nostoc sp. MS1 TaxID=2764711 RepID=UPI001CC5C09A|nr:hypothetical protein [Nostoc sp. MS1]BCL36525.1 hypothetical protein NSMS1_29720 [Nostoc sp. MS1]
MKPSTLKLLTPMLVALITASATVVADLINKPSSQGNNSINYKPTNQSSSTASKCDIDIVNKVCVSHITVQINSDEPQQVKYAERLALKTGDKIKLLGLTYCILSQTKLNKLEAKAVLFKHGIENYQNTLLTPSSFPINTGCHSINNFPKSWQMEAGQHRVIIPIIKYDGSYRVVDKNFYLNLDVGN